MTARFTINRSAYLRHHFSSGKHHFCANPTKAETRLLNEVIAGLGAFSTAYEEAGRVAAKPHNGNPYLADLAHAIRREPVSALSDGHSPLAVSQIIFTKWRDGEDVSEETLVPFAQWARLAFNQGRDIIFAGIAPKPTFSGEETETFSRPQAALNYLGALAYAYDALCEAHFNSHKTNKAVPLSPLERWQVRPR